MNTRLHLKQEALERNPLWDDSKGPRKCSILNDSKLSEVRIINGVFFSYFPLFITCVTLMIAISSHFIHYANEARVFETHRFLRQTLILMMLANDSVFITNPIGFRVLEVLQLPTKENFILPFKMHKNKSILYETMVVRISLHSLHDMKIQKIHNSVSIFDVEKG